MNEKVDRVMGDKQKFHYGDLVRIEHDSDSNTVRLQALVITSYCQSSVWYYGLFVEGVGKRYWYYENQLSLIERNRSDLLITWKFALRCLKM
jgi:hypothetical protein